MKMYVLVHNLSEWKTANSKQRMVFSFQKNSLIHHHLPDLAYSYISNYEQHLLPHQMPKIRIIGMCSFQPGQLLLRIKNTTVIFCLSLEILHICHTVLFFLSVIWNLQISTHKKEEGIC